MARSAPARGPSSSGPRVNSGGGRTGGGYRGPSAAPRGTSGYRGPSAVPRGSSGYRGPSNAYRSNGAYRGNGAYARQGGSGYAVPRHPYNGYGYGHYYGRNSVSHYPYYGNRYGYGHYGYGHYPYYRYYGNYYRAYYPYYYPYYSWGFYYGYPYYWGAYYGYPYWGAYWGWPYGSVGFSYYGGGGGGDYDASDYQGSARLEVKPRQTEVFVDGYYAGVVDDFDGFKRLRLEPGEHEVTLYLDGYQPLSKRMLFTQGQTFRVEHQMQPLAAGEPMPARPTPSAKPAPPQRDPGYGNGGNAVYPRSNGGSTRPSMRISDGAPPEASEPARTDIEIVDPSRAPGGPSGTLSVRVQPEDAEILVDGEPWARSGGDRLVVSLAPGVHRLEIRKPGFETYSGLVRVRPGAGTTLNVALAPDEKR